MAGATITFDTDVGGSTQVEYGTTTAYGSLTTYVNNRITTGHTVTLVGLPAAATIHYRIRSRNGAGTETVTSDATFVTSGTSSSVIITWTTDTPASSQVDYGDPGGASGVYTHTTTLDPARVTSHSVTLTGIGAGVTHYRVRGRNQAGTETISADQTFTVSAAASAKLIVVIS